MTRTYSHAGDAGDVIFSLPVIRALGGGTLALHAESWTRERMTESKVQSIRSLLITQPYIQDVRWLAPNEKADINLNDFRSEYFRTFRHPNFPKRRNLCEWILRTHGVDPAEQEKQWLFVEPRREARVIINRTGAGRDGRYVYRNPAFPWRKVLHQYHGQFAFVGTAKEHKEFTNRMNWQQGYPFPIPYLETPNLLTLAQVIAGADLFIGNQSLPYAIAEGLKKRAVLEVCPWLPNCLFEREDVIHGWDSKVELPGL